MQSWKIDPSTGDYVIENGSPVETDSLTIPAYFRLKAKRGRWLNAPDTNWGSDFYTITKRPSENANQRLENIAVSALQPLVDDGRADSVEVNVLTASRGSAGLETKIVDASGEVETETFKGLGF